MCKVAERRKEYRLNVKDLEHDFQFTKVSKCEILLLGKEAPPRDRKQRRAGLAALPALCCCVALCFLGSQFGGLPLS